MCRLVLMNKNGEREIEKNYGLTNFLRFLEKKFGGHGNGVALLKDKKVVLLSKGVNLSVKEIANIIKRKNYDWCIFHTRFASVGGKSDRNCHPFKIGTEVMAMNGTERTERLLTSAKDITDTEAILTVIQKFNLGIPVLKNLSSNFVGFSKGKPYIVANNIYNIKLMYKKKDNSIVFASEFPEKIRKNIYEPIEEFIWYDENINLQNFQKYKKKKLLANLFEEVYPFDEFSYYGDLYEQYYRQEEKDKSLNNKGGYKNVA